MARSVLPILLLAVPLAGFLHGCERTFGRQACRLEKEMRLFASDGVPEAVAVTAVAEGRYLGLWSADRQSRAVWFDSDGVRRSAPLLIPLRADQPLAEGSRKNILPELGSRDAGSARRDDDRLAAPIRGGTTPPNGMGPRPRMGSSLFAGPEAAAPTGSAAAPVKSFWPAEAEASIDAVDIDAVRLDDRRVAAALLSQPSHAGRGGAYVAVIEEARVAAIRRIGPAGAYAGRISLIARPDALLIAWHDGMLTRSGIRLVKTDRAAQRIIAEAAVQTNGAAASPTLSFKGGVVTMAWSETLGGEQGGESVVKIAAVHDDLTLSPRSVLATSRYIHPSPELAAAEDGLALVFRDDADGDGTPEYHFIPLTETGAPAGERQRISASDGLRGPQLVSADHGFIGATIRSFQRNLLIGLNRMDPRGEKLGGEFQVYADKSDFIRVAIAENRGEVMIIYAEDRQEKGRILAGAVQCAPRER